MSGFWCIWYTIGLAFSIWGATTATGFWQAWCIAWGVANALLLIREVCQ